MARFLARWPLPGAIALSLGILATACRPALPPEPPRAPPSPAEERAEEPRLLTYAEYDARRVDPPYVIEVEADRGALLYYGARHTNDPRDPQIADIERRFIAFRPTLALAEGPMPVPSPTAAESVERGGEPCFLAYLARRHGVEIGTLEMEQSDEVRLLAERYTREQVKAFYVLRRIGTYFRVKPPEPLDRWVERVLADLSSVAGLEGKPRDADELDRVLAAMVPGLRSWREPCAAWTTPTENLGLTNAIARYLDTARDLHMIDVIAEAVADGERVMAVVGMSHVVIQEPVIRARLERLARRGRADS